MTTEVRPSPPRAASLEPRAVLSIAGVSKAFGPVQALADVSVDCRRGEVHAVLGENGSGKSTLLAIASGVLTPDEGSVHIVDRPLRAGHPSEARELGLAMAYQSYSLVPQLSVAHNLVLAAREEQRPRRHRDSIRWAGDRLERLGVDFDPRAMVAGLSLAQRQFLEVVKALVAEPAILLLDEPTTALGPTDVERLHQLVLGRVANGMGVMYVSHRLPEVLSVADRVTVLRDGRSLGTLDADEVTEHHLVELMIGRPVELAFPDREDEPSRGRAPVLTVTGLSGEHFGPVSFEVGRGEIVGLAGAEGNGQDGLMRALAGLEPVAGGDIQLSGRHVRPGDPREALEDGIMLLSGERARESLFSVLPVRSNVTPQVLGAISRLGWIRRRAEAALAAEATDRLNVRTPSIEQPVRFLSGGNQQKVVLTRPFLRDVELLLAEEPTQGVDVRSRFEIYEALRARADEGVGMVVRTSDPIELAGLCDRVLVVSRGRVVGQLEGSRLTEDQIVDAIVRAEGPVEATGRSPAGPARSRPAGRPWAPLAVLALLSLLIGWFTAARSDAFLSEFNLSSLLLLTVPLGLVSMGQLQVLLVREFDVSVGALAGLTVVAASFLLDEPGWGVITLGVFALIGMALVVGTVNTGLVRLLAIPSIIATIATLSVLQGLSLVLRPTPGGLVDGDFSRRLTDGVGFVPYAFVGVVVLAVVLDYWLYRTRSGLMYRALGFEETAAERMGASPGRFRWRAFLGAAVFAGAAGLFMAAIVGVGDPRIGGTFALSSIAAAVLGGAALSGGRGSFVGALLGALFLTLLFNALPLLGWTSAWGDISRGAVTLAALALFELGRLIGRRRRTGASEAGPQAG